LQNPDRIKGKEHAKMATIQELVKQYDTDPELRKEVDAILEDGKITMKEFLTFAGKHEVDVSLKDLPKIISEAKKLGLVD
jgi:hypothetical protein